MAKKKAYRNQGQQPQQGLTLYHYTSTAHLQQILTDREIKLTCSNLLPPKNPRIVNGNVVSDTDNYKPVVWFSSVLDFNAAAFCGLAGSIVDKTEAAIMVVIRPPMIAHKRAEWATANDIETEWFNRLKATAPAWETFYITEYPVKFDENTRIIFRPDIAAELKYDAEGSE